MFKLCRPLLLAVAVLALAAAPALADPEPVTAPAPAVQASSGCGPSLDLLAPDTEAAVCKTPDLQTAVPVEPEFMAQGFRGYCRCGCSVVKNCNTSADCGGSACLAGITCC
jgi:hypothetical protein